MQVRIEVVLGFEIPEGMTDEMAIKRFAGSQLSKFADAVVSLQEDGELGELSELLANTETLTVITD